VQPHVDVAAEGSEPGLDPEGHVGTPQQGGGHGAEHRVVLPVVEFDESPERADRRGCPGALSGEACLKREQPRANETLCFDSFEHGSERGEFTRSSAGSMEHALHVSSQRDREDHLQ
jgi:hypothetical protein